MYSTITQLYKQPLEMNISTAHAIQGSSHDPSFFGPSFWFTLHNGATAYPYQPTEIIKQGMKHFIYGLPIMIPCLSCKEHAYVFIKKSNIDYCVSSKANLFKFFVDFHNHVNERYRRPLMCLDEAKELYGYNNPNGSAIRINYH